MLIWDGLLLECEYRALEEEKLPCREDLIMVAELRKNMGGGVGR